MKSLAIIISLLLMPSITLAVDSNGNYAVWGIGKKSCFGYNEAMTIGRAQDKAILSMLAANKISIKEPLEEVLKKVQEETSNILMEDTIARTFKY